jgi:hypothetical protein
VSNGEFSASDVACAGIVALGSCEGFMVLISRNG